MKKALLKTENIFLILCLFWGIVFLFINPPFQSPDELEHFYKMWGYTQHTLKYEIKEGQTGLTLPKSFSNIHAFYNAYRMSNEKIPFNATLNATKIKLDKNNTQFLNFTPTSYTPLSYFPSFIVLWILKLLNIKPLCMMYILRFCSLLVYLALTYSAIKIAPCKKWLIFFFALLPINVYQAASVSTDGITLGFIMLYIAYTLKLAYGDFKQISNNEFFVWGGLITLVSILKFAYFPLILLYFLIPKDKFESTKNYIKIFSITTIINILIICLFLLTIMQSPITSNYGLEHQFVNKFDLIKEIIFAPFAYIKNVLASTNFLKGFLYQNMISSIGVTLAMIPAQYIHFAWIGLIASVFYKSENETECNIKIADRIMLFAVIILIHFIIMTSVYLIYQTKPYIIGVQGRYLTPLILPLILLLSSTKFSIKNKVLPISLVLLSLFLLFQTFIMTFVRYY